MISEAQMLERFERVRRQRDGDWLVTCPAHADRTPSLHLTLAEDRWLLKCHAGCETEDVLDAAGLSARDLFAESRSNGHREIVAEYDYVDEDGKLQYQVVRKPGKEFPQRRPDPDSEDGWRWGLSDKDTEDYRRRYPKPMPPARRVPYRLPQVLAAIRDGVPIWIVEGEKDVQALERAGFTATCNPGGAGKWRPEYGEALRGAKAIVCGDCDEAGKKHVRQVAEMLAGTATVKLLELDALTEGRNGGYDVADLLAEAGDEGPTLLRSTVKNARVFALPGGGSRPETREGTTTTTLDRYSGRRVDLAARLQEPRQPTAWRCGDFVADGTLTVLSSQSGDGKSWLALALAVGVARGHAVAGIPCEKGRALYVDGEMGEAMFVDRVRDAGIGAEIDVIDAMGLDFSREEDLSWLRAEIQLNEAKFVAIDSLRRLVPSKSENDSDDMAPVVAALAKLARDTSAAIVLIHHMGDNSEKFFRGSSAIKDQADALFALLRDENDSDVRRLACRGGKGKMRYAAEPADRFLVIEPERGGVEAVDAPDPDDGQSVSETVKAGILSHLPAATKTKVATELGRRLEDRTFREAWKELQAQGKIAQEGAEWVVVVPETPSQDDDYHPESDRSTSRSGETKTLQERCSDEWERLKEMGGGGDTPTPQAEGWRHTPEIRAFQQRLEEKRRDGGVEGDQ